MMISLPSMHSCGMLKLSHSGQVKEFSTSKHMASWAAWYSDVHREMTPVANGYRLVMTFNLIQPATTDGTYSSRFEQRYPALGEAMRMWSQACKEWYHEEPAIYTLEHEYKGVRIMVVSVISNAAIVLTSK